MQPEVFRLDLAQSGAAAEVSDPASDPESRSLLVSIGSGAYPTDTYLHTLARSLAYLLSLA